jgi:ribosomal protein S12 methylthiotransferase
MSNINEDAAKTVKFKISDLVTEHEDMKRIMDAEYDDGLSYVARTYKDAPDIDGYLFISGVQRELMTGDYVKVRITGSNEYDLIGEMEE